MCLRFVFLLITRVITWLRLSRREDAWKTAEILIPRHQLAVLQRHQARRPKLTWADRALLATLFGVMPSSSSVLNCRIEMLELDSGIRGREAPVDPTTRSVARRLPRRDLPL
jgi:hypothetical protein